MTELTKQVAANGDDGYDFGTTFVNDQTSVYFGNDGANQVRSFHRFTSVAIPVGSTITSAKMQFRATFDRSGATCNLKVHFEAADNPTAPSSHADLTGRSLTTGASWSSVGAWTTGTWYDSVDITSDLQAIIDRPGWAENNALTAHVLNNSSSSGAYRQAQTYEAGASYAAKLVVNYSAPQLADLTDQEGAGDSVDGFSLTDSIADAGGIGDAVEGYDFAGLLSDAAAANDAIGATAEIEAALSDQAGIADQVSGDAEIEASLSDGAGGGDSADALNWTGWLADNLDRSVVRYYCTITGAADGTTDIEVPISSFQARKRSGYSTYLSVVVPGVAYADAIDARPNGDIVIDMAYLIGGVESQREEIVRAEIEQINIQEGPGSRSITLIGHKDQTFIAKESRLYDPVYKARTDGSLSYRFAVPDLWLNPGDTAQVDSDEFTVDTVVMMVSAGGGQTTMEVQE